MGLPSSMFLDVAKFRRLQIHNIRWQKESYDNGDYFTVDFENGKSWSFFTDRPDIFLSWFELELTSSAHLDERHFHYSEWKPLKGTLEYRQMKLNRIVR